MSSTVFALAIQTCVVSYWVLVYHVSPVAPDCRNNVVVYKRTWMWKWFGNEASHWVGWTRWQADPTQWVDGRLKAKRKTQFCLWPWSITLWDGKYVSKALYSVASMTPPMLRVWEQLAVRC